MKLGIYGGTFNPPHLGHLTSARLALDALGLDELRFVPAALPPHKRLPPDAPGPEARLEMVELAADGLLLPGRVSVSDMELSRPGKSYTADTLEQLLQLRVIPHDGEHRGGGLLFAVQAHISGAVGASLKHDQQAIHSSTPPYTAPGPAGSRLRSPGTP